LKDFLRSQAVTYIAKYLGTRNHKHRRAAAKPAACAKPLILSTLWRKEGEVGKEVGRDEGRNGGRREGGRKKGRERGAKEELVI